MPRRSATIPVTAPLAPTIVEKTEVEAPVVGLRIKPPPVNGEVRLADGSIPDPSVVFEHIVGDLWRCNARLLDVDHPKALNGRQVTRVLLPENSTVSTFEKDRIVNLIEARQ